MSVPNLLTAALFALAAAASLPVSAQIVGTAARVNGNEITNLRLERFFDEYVKDKGRNITKMINPKVYKKLKREALDQLIDREVLGQAAREKGVTVADADVDAALRDMIAQAKGRDAFLRRLERTGFDEKAYFEYVRREIAIRRYLEKQIPLPELKDEDVAAFYEANPKLFTRPETAHARHILVAVEAGAEGKEKEDARVRAASLLADVRKGEDFATLAQRYSEDRNSRDQGGDLGEFRRGQMVEAFDNAVFSMEPGQVSEVVESEYGFHVIRLESRKPSGLVPLNEVKEKIRTNLANQRRDEAAKKHVEELRALAKIEKFVRLED
jgi:peptidyl-prolyl cis-trans isomerase C